MAAEGVQFGKFLLPLTQVFHRTALSYASVNLKPIVPGHSLVLPLRRVMRYVQRSTLRWLCCCSRRKERSLTRSQIQGALERGGGRLVADSPESVSRARAAL